MRYVIIGNGPAGTFAAKEIRDRDSSASLTTVSKDNHPFYSRPRLTEVLSGKSSPEEICVFPQKWYEEKGIDLKLKTTVKKLRLDKNELVFATDETVGFDKLLIASGSVPKRLPIKGIEGKNIFTVSTASDALTVNSLAERSRKAVVIGGGSAGLEAASSMVSLGVRVTVIEIADRLLAREIDSEGSAIVKRHLESIGIKFLVGVSTEEIKDEDDKKTVVTTEGRCSKADFVLIAAGMVPAITLAEDAGLRCSTAITVNDNMETSAQGVYAAGDAAEHEGKMYGLWSVSKEQGETAGKNMAGEAVCYRGSVRAAYLKIAGLNLAFMGDIIPGKTEDVTVHKNANANSGVYKKLFVSRRILRGAVLIGDTSLAPKLKSAIGKDFSAIEEAWEKE